MAKDIDVTVLGIQSKKIVTTKDLKEILAEQRHVMALNVTLEAEPGDEYKKKLIEALEPCKYLEQVEIIANPTLEFFMEVRASYVTFDQSELKYGVSQPVSCEMHACKC